MQQVVARLFSGVSPKDFGGDVHFVCAGDIPAPAGFEDHWSAIPTDQKPQQPSWVCEQALLRISAIVAISNVAHEPQNEAIATIGGYLHLHSLVAPPVILLPVADGAAPFDRKTGWPAIQQQLSNAIIDDVAWGMPAGFALALAVHAKRRNVDTILNQVQHDLSRRALEADRRDRLADAIDFAQWQYLGTRLLHSIPPVREDLDDGLGHGVAGYRLGAKLCRGVFGAVYKTSRGAADATDTHHYSMLVVEKRPGHHSLLDLKMINRFLSVMEGLTTVRHPNISHLVSVFHLPKRLCVCMEVGGRQTLFTRLRSRDAPKEDAEPWAVATPILSQIMLQVCSAVIHIHEVHRVCHRDLKPENCTISDECEEGKFNLKLSGFELASVQGADLKCKSPCGTMPFAAPEAFLAGSAGYDGMAADMWSLGILLLEVVSGIRVVERLISRKTGVDRFSLDAGVAVAPVPEFARSIRSIFSECGVLDELLASAAPEARALFEWFDPLVRGLLVSSPEGRLSSTLLRAALPAPPSPPSVEAQA